MLSARTIESDHADACTYLQGDLDAAAAQCNAPGAAGPASLVFASDLAQLATARANRAAILVVNRAMSVEVTADDGAVFGCCFVARDVPMAMFMGLPPTDLVKVMARSSGTPNSPPIAPNAGR